MRNIFWWILKKILESLIFSFFLNLLCNIIFFFYIFLNGIILLYFFINKFFSNNIYKLQRTSRNACFFWFLCFRFIKIYFVNQLLSWIHALSLFLNLICLIFLFLILLVYLVLINMILLRARLDFVKNLFVILLWNTKRQIFLLIQFLCVNLINIQIDFVLVIRGLFKHESCTARLYFVLILIALFSILYNLFCQWGLLEFFLTVVLFVALFCINIALFMVYFFYYILLFFRFIFFNFNFRSFFLVIYFLFNNLH